MESDEFDIRHADAGDLGQIVRLLWDDPVGRTRESVRSEEEALYKAAFAEIEKDPNSTLLVATANGKVIGCIQLTLIPGLSYQGVRRCLIEDVRVIDKLRGRGIGAKLLQSAERIACLKGCRLMELLVHRDRADAHRFYEREGYQGMHRGFRKQLSPDCSSSS